MLARFGVRTPTNLAAFKARVAGVAHLLRSAQGSGARPPSSDLTVYHSRATARGLRSRKAVHGDVTALLRAGMLERTESGRVEFPFDAVQVEFTLRAAC